MDKKRFNTEASKALISAYQVAGILETFKDDMGMLQNDDFGLIDKLKIIVNFLNEITEGESV